MITAWTQRKNKTGRIRRTQHCCGTKGFYKNVTTADSRGLRKINKNLEIVAINY